MLALSLLAAPAAAVSAQSTAPARAGVFSTIETAPGELIEVPVSIENASGLYAVDIELQFDPALLSAEDADPNTPGIQTGFGQFLEPGLVLFNTVDLQKGTVRFAMSQVNPSEPKSGSGVLFVIYFKALNAGVSPLKVTNLQLASRAGEELASTPADSTLTIAAGVTPAAATSVPVQNPTVMILLPTPGPTVLSTAAPTRTPALTGQTTPKAGSTPAADAATQSVAIPLVQTSDSQKPFLVENWWIVLIVALLVLGLGWYLLKSRK
jgi:hypothetical protein